MNVCQDILSSNINNFVFWNHFFIELDNHKKYTKESGSNQFFFNAKNIQVSLMCFLKKKNLIMNSKSNTYLKIFYKNTEAIIYYINMDKLELINQVCD